jgi:hypothetical protein
MTMKTLDRPSGPSLSTNLFPVRLVAERAAPGTFEARLATVVWALIGLVFLVVGAHAVVSAHPEPQHQIEILADPDFHPFPVPAPVGPTPPDAALVASAR